MTIVHMSEKGQIVVPKDIRDAKGFSNGSAFMVMQTKSGNVILRPVSGKPKMDLVDHLFGLKGLEIPQRKHLSPPRV